MRVKQEGTIYVDDTSNRTISPKKADILDVVGMLYVGGLPINYTTRRIGPVSVWFVSFVAKIDAWVMNVFWIIRSHWPNYRWIESHLSWEVTIFLGRSMREVTVRGMALLGQPCPVSASAAGRQESRVGGIGPLSPGATWVMCYRCEDRGGNTVSWK